MNYAYIRVSTDKQTVENQKFEILKFANQKNLPVEQWVEETASGTLSSKDRKLGEVITRLQKGDTLIVAELSRLGRSLLDVMTILNTLMKKEVRVFSIKENYELGNNISSKVLAFAFSLSAEIERQLISQRTREALQRRKSEGKSLGRPIGYKLDSVKLSGKEAKIKELIKFGVSNRAIGRMFSVHPNTVAHFVRSRDVKK